MWLKVLIVVLLLAIIASLGSSLVFLLHDQGQSRRTVNALFVRVGLSALLVSVVIYGLATGELVPHPVWAP